jgi:phenylacetate-CoA ligase
MNKIRIKEFILKNTIFKNRLQLLIEKKSLYRATTKPKHIHKYQLDKFNNIWIKAHSDIPFYKMWMQKHNLPEKIHSIDELKNFPTLTKKDIQSNYDLIFDHLHGYKVISTGGSTGEPTKFPTSLKEQEEIYASVYLARSWWGINPLDDMLMLWGHSHLFGAGVKGKINQIRRWLADWLINTQRLNAYDMSIEKIEKHYVKVRMSNPKSIIGYASSIYRLAKYIDDNNLSLGNKSNLKGVVVTSETATKLDIKLIEKVFKVSCINEYGMAEAGVISYSKTTQNNIMILWDMFIATKGENNILNITSLYDKKFPLINYKTNDAIDILESYGSSVLKIKSIDGRRNDEIVLLINEVEVEVHSEIFTHIIKSINGIIDFRVVQNKNLSIDIYIDTQDIVKIQKKFYKNLSLEFNSFNKQQFNFHYRRDMPLTIAGKTKWISRELV